MAFSLHGIKVPHRKNTAGMSPVRMPVPQTVSIPMAMHIGKPAIPVVKVGDHVDVGTLIANPDGFISAAVHSSVSGTVKKIDDMLMSNGTQAQTVVIESDGEMTPDPALCPPVIENAQGLVDAIRDSGIIGLGGAGFPTYAKFSVDSEKIEELIINGAECEPYITSDTRAMIERADDIEYAIGLFTQYMGVKKIIIGIENNKPEAIASMQNIAASNPVVSVKVLPSVYPQGGEKVMVYHTTGKTVPAGKLPIDVGCIVCNCSTMADIGKYAKTGMPLVERCITVDGSAVASPMNVIVPVGTAMADVFEFCGGFKSEPGKVFYGGPMMGVTVPDISAPIMKNTNAIIAFDEKDSVMSKPQPCIRCGRCVNVCPFGINPPLIAKALGNKDTDELAKLGVDVCMECGSCAYVCPANRPIVQNNRIAKAELREARARKKAKEANK